MKCKICNDNGECLNDDIYDCVEYLEEKNGIKKGQWMIDWMRRLKEKESKEPYVSDFVKWSKSIKGMYILFFILLLSCSSLVSNEPVENENKLYVTLNPRLPEDSNGYYHLSINRNNWQTIHRIDGNVVDNNDNPVEVVRFEWESDLYWYLGDTLGVIYHVGLTDQYVYVTYDTTYIIGFDGFVVPTINPASYSNGDGEFSQMTGFVRSMVGDTASISVSYYDGLVVNELSIGIILE